MVDDGRRLDNHAKISLDSRERPLVAGFVVAADAILQEKVSQNQIKERRYQTVADFQAKKSLLHQHKCFGSLGSALIC